MSMTPQPALRPLISVIIPCWNAEAWARDAVSACLHQEGVLVEAILVDDGSTDGTPALLEAMAAKDDRIRVIRTPTNGGPSQARNLGVAAARGDWVAFADSDDVMLPGRLARLARLGDAWGADVVADQQLETVYPAMTGGMPAFETMGTDEAAPVSLEDYLRLAREGNADARRPPIRRSFGQLKPFIRRDFLARTGLEHDARFRTGEDLHFQVRCLAAGAKMIYVNAPGYLYRRREDSLTYEDSLSYTRLIALADDLMRLSLDSHSQTYLRTLRYVWRGRAAYQAMRPAVKQGAYLTALACLWRSGLTGWIKLLGLPFRRISKRKRLGKVARRMKSAASAAG
jgi:glycosyltransferase involved in cell wall biosynthesis